MLIRDGHRQPEKALEAFLRADPPLRAGPLQNETLTRPVGDYMIFIDGINASLVSTLFGAIVKSNTHQSSKVSEVAGHWRSLALILR